MEKIDRVLLKEIKSNKRHSKSFVKFVSERNKDSNLYDEYLNKEKGNVEDSFTLSEYIISQSSLLFLPLLLLFILLQGSLYDTYAGTVITIIAFILLLVSSLFLSYRLSCLVFPFFATSRVKNCKDSWAFVAYIEMGMTYKDYLGL